jgi:hypothetical protein
LEPAPADAARREGTEWRIDLCNARKRVFAQMFCPPLNPLWEVRGGLQERVFGEAPACHLPFQASGRPTSPFSPCGGWGEAYRGGFLGKPLRAIFCFRRQDAQTPPSPLVGEGGRGMRGKRARECRTSLIVPKNSSGVRCAPSPALSPGRFSGKPLHVIFRSRRQDAQPPPSPLVGEGGRGDEGQARTGMQDIAHRSQKLVRRSLRALACPLTG